MHEIENALIRMADLDWGWWPFLGLRPAKNEEMTTERVAMIAASFGVFFAPLPLLLLALAGVRFSLSVTGGVAALSVLCFFGVYRLTMAPAWNRRARWLRRHYRAPSPRPSDADSD